MGGRAMTSPGRPEDRPLVERPDDDDYDLLTRNEATVRLREEIITLQQAVQAWNDFHLDEWCASAPDRFIPSGILPTWDIELAAPEARRLADRGFRAVSFPDSPVPLGMPPFHGNAWDPLWDVVSQEEICVCLHFGSSGFMPGFSFGSNIDQNRDQEGLPAPFAIALFSSNLQWSTVEPLLSGTLQRFPKLQFMLSEGGIGWIPYILEARGFLFGLLADLPRKNCWSIAEHAADRDPHGMQHLLNRAVWDTDGVCDDLRDYVITHLGDIDAVLVVDLCRYRDYAEGNGARL
jgi:predicted TIM-barrel fold metal-dependent hydrolase